MSCENKKHFIVDYLIKLMVYAVYSTKSFDKEIAKLSQSDQEIIQKMFLKIKENPYLSDQLRYKNLREKRIREKRIYFLVYDDLEAVLFVAIGGKKGQQATIGHIIDYFDEYRIYLEELLKRS